MNDLMTISGTGPLVVPEHLRGLGLDVNRDMMATVGDNRNRIGLKGNRFRQIVNGQEIGVWDENYLDVIVVGTVPSLSRLFYKDKYKQSGDNAAPTCYSVDNVTPSEDVINKQSPTCATCPQNIKGSRVTEHGAQTKACSYFRRMAIILPGDNTLYYVDVKSMGLFGDSNKALLKFNMNDYAKYLSTVGVDASVLITRLSFDTDESVPKLLFQPSRWATSEEMEVVMSLRDSKEVAEYLQINMKTVDISHEVAEPEVVVPEPAKPTAAVQRPVPAPVAKPVQTQQQPKGVDTGVPKPVAAPKPTVAAPKPVAVAKPVVAEPAAVPQEVTMDKELSDMLDSLNL